MNRKYQLGGMLNLSPEELKYLEWSIMSPGQKRDRNVTIAGTFLKRGPSIGNYWNALKAYFGGFNPTNPKLGTGAPTILPGRMNHVLMMEREAPTIFKMVAENSKNAHKFDWRTLGNDYRVSVLDGLKKFFKTGDRNILRQLEDWAVKNKDAFYESTGISSLTKPKGFLNYSSPNKAVDYTLRGLTKPKPMSDQQWGDSDFEDFGSYIDRVVTIRRKGGKLFGIKGIGL